MSQKVLSLYTTVGTSFNQLIGLVLCMRVKQWTKNLLVFAALIFSSGQASVHQININFMAFIIFCFLSSSVYLLNDFVDRKADRLHLEKCTRPMAAGLLNPYVGLFGCFFLLSISVIGGIILDQTFALVLIIYFVNNVLYSFKLKHVVLIDIMSIASGFVLRAIGGGLAIKVPLTPWFLLCAFLLSLFLAIGKRRYELNSLDSQGQHHRKVLKKYSLKLIDQLIAIVTTATIMCYSLFTFTSGKPVELMFTIPVVIYGIFRYLYLIYVENKGGTPEEILVSDKPILLSVVFYSVLVVVILKNYPSP